MMNPILSVVGTAIHYDFHNVHERAKSQRSVKKFRNQQ